MITITLLLHRNYQYILKLNTSRIVLVNAINMTFAEMKLFEYFVFDTLEFITCSFYVVLQPAVRRLHNILELQLSIKLLLDSCGAFNGNS